MEQGRLIGNHPQLLGLEVQRNRPWLLQTDPTRLGCPHYLEFPWDIRVSKDMWERMVSSTRICDFSPKETLGMVSAISLRLGWC